MNMTVWQIVEHFTSMDFTLVLYDVGSYDVVWEGLAGDIQNEPESYYQVVAMMPPKQAEEVILVVDTEDEFAYDDEAYIVAD